MHTPLPKGQAQTPSLGALLRPACHPLVYLCSPRALRLPDGLEPLL